VYLELIVISEAKAAKKAIFIGIVLISVNQLSGLFAFLNYTADIFQEAGSVFTPNMSAIIVGILLFVGSLVSLTLVDKYSRRFLYTVTTVGNLIGLMAMGVHSYCKTIEDVSNFKLIPVVSLSLIIFCASAGRLPLTYIMMAEIMPQNMRSFGVSISTTCNWVLAFVLLRIFSTIVDLFKFHVCMFIFFGFALFGMIFVMIYVPETKNKSFEEIENSLKGHKFTSHEENGTRANEEELKLRVRDAEQI
jgi:MFS family permease